MDRLAEHTIRIKQLLSEHHHSVAVAEGAAGGLISAGLLSTPGASAFFVAGAVLYTRQGFRDFLGDRKHRMRGLRGASEPFSIELARIAREKFDCTWAIAESGAAGPAGNRYGDPPGHAAIAIAGPAERTITVETKIDDRSENMWRFAESAFDLFIATLTDR